jgi:predicted TIM-barrel enzyme
MADDLEAQALRREIEQTRTELGQTVELLAARMDVKARARVKALQVREQVRRGVGQSPAVAALLAGAAAGLLALLVTRLVQGRSPR